MPNLVICSGAGAAGVVVFDADVACVFATGALLLCAITECTVVKPTKLTALNKKEANFITLPKIR